MAVPVDSSFEFSTDYVYYILSENKTGYEIIHEHGLHSEPQETPVQILKGSIVKQKKPTHLHLDRDAEIAVETTDNNPKTLTCKKRYVIILQQYETQLLIAIPNNHDRFKVFMDKEWLKEGDFIGVGIVVNIVDKNQFGKVRYKGVVQGRRGIVFGIELAKEFQGKGTCDGEYHKHRYFSCARNSAVFLPLSKIRLTNQQEKFQERTSPVGEAEVTRPPAAYEVDSGPLLRGERVVWISDTGAHYGMVRWVGYLADNPSTDLTIGVEFDNEIGSGSGMYEGQQLFQARRGHASLIPIMGLMKADEYEKQDTILPFRVTKLPPLTSEYMYHVYLGYDGLDEQIAMSMKNILEKVGFTCCTAIGQKFPVENITKYINASRAIIFVITKNFIDTSLFSYQVQQINTREMSRERAVVVPVLMSGVEKRSLPSRLQSVSYLTFNNDSTFYKRLIKAIGGEVVERESSQEGRETATAKRHKASPDSDRPSESYVKQMVLKNHYIFRQMEISTQILQDCVNHGVLSKREMDNLRQKSRTDRIEPFLNLLILLDRGAFDAFIGIFKTNYPKLNASLIDVTKPDVDFKKIIQQHWYELVHTLRFSDVRDELISQRVLVYEAQTIQALPTPHEQVRALLDKLLTKDQKAYEIFLQALKVPCPHLYKLLTTPVQETPDFEQTVKGRIKQGDTEYKKTLQKYKLYLSKKMDVTEILDCLYQKGVLTNAKRLDILSKITMRGKADALVDFLLKGEPRDYAYFLEFLVKDHEHLYQLLVEGKYDDNLDVYTEVLQEKRNMLLTNLDPSYIIDHLTTSRVVNEFMREDFNSKRTSHERVTYLLDLLPRRGSSGFIAFIQALDVTNQSHISQPIKEAVKDKMQMRQDTRGTPVDPRPPADPIPETIHIEVLQKNLVNLMKYIDVTNSMLLDMLLAGLVVTQAEMVAIRGAVSNTKAVSVLIDILCRKGYFDYQKFLEALFSTNQAPVAEFLNKSEDHLREAKQGSKTNTANQASQDAHSRHRIILNKQRTALIENIDLKYSYLIDVLIQNSVLSYEEAEYIRAVPIEHQQTSYLIDTLCKKSSSDYRIFVNALIETNQGHVARILTNSEENVRQEQQKTSQVRSSPELIHREILNNNRPTLVQLVDLQHTTLLDIMIQHEGLSFAELQLIQESEGQPDQITRLVDILCKRHYDDYKTFIKALRETNQGHVAKLLIDTERRLKEQQPATSAYREKVVSDSSPVTSPKSPTEDYDYTSLTPRDEPMDTATKIPPKRISPVPLDPKQLDTELDIGSMAEVNISDPPQFGLIKWVGHNGDPSKPIAGLEMEEEISAGTDGTLGGKRIFFCPPKRALFIHLMKCQPDRRFMEEPKPPELAFGSLESPDIQGHIEPPTDLTEDEIIDLCGKKRGIQGHHNSCYLDATLFCMFSFSYAFDQLLERPRKKTDIREYDEVKKVLRESIVNPLRQNFYVRADKILKLRTSLDKLSEVQGLVSEEKDPEEFLNSLLQYVLKSDYLIKLSPEGESPEKENHHCYFYQVFGEKDTLLLPTTQKLLGLSFYDNKIKFSEVPACLILQMPRSGKDFKMYSRILPSLELDVTDLIENEPRECAVCGALATHECRDCFRHFNEAFHQVHMGFCDLCVHSTHQHRHRRGHETNKISVSKEYLNYINKHGGSKHPDIVPEKLELFAVLCIETSHYVAFVKCGQRTDSPWVFFDSMADRRGQENGYNIPEMTFHSDIPYWLSKEGYDRLVKTPFDRDLPVHIRRLVCDAYMCFYRSDTASMYF